MTGKTKTKIETNTQLYDLLNDNKIVTETKLQSSQIVAELLADTGAMALASTVYRLQQEPQTLGPKWAERQAVYFIGLLTDYIESYYYG